MIRAVIAALLAVALLAASQPAIERSRVAHADTRVTSELTAVRTAILDLLASDDPVPVEAAGARRKLTVSLPSRSWASAGIERVVFGPACCDRDRLTWELTSGAADSLSLPVNVRGPDGGPLVIERAGRHQIILRLVRIRGDQTVVARRLSVDREGAT